jgi:cytochrome P450
VDHAGIDLDPSDEGFLADPHRVFDRLRHRPGPVRDPRGWSVLTYEGCHQAFLDTALVPGIHPSPEQLGHREPWCTRDRTLAGSEGDVHTRLRGAVAPWFTPGRITALRERTRGLVRERLTDHDPGLPLPLMAQLADLVPARLFCWAAGAPESDAGMLAAWSRTLLAVFTAGPEMVERVRVAKEELAAYTTDLLAHKKTHPGDDLASELAAAAAAGAIDEQDAYFLLEEMLSASVDNTANTTGLALHTLAEHPRAWAALHAAPSLVPTAVEECGRFQPAIRHTIRYAVADTVVDGTSVEQGSLVTLRIAAAHRDPAVYDAPHVFDEMRAQPRPQLAFGAGRHFCPGAALARMEVQEMVAGLTSAWRVAEIADGARLNIAAAGLVHELPLRPAA